MGTKFEGLSKNQQRAKDAGYEPPVYAQYVPLGYELGGCMMGHGASSVYFTLPNETKYAYCAMKFLEFTEISCKEYTEDEAEATSIMNKAAFITCPRKRSAEENINKILSTRTSAKR